MKKINKYLGQSENIQKNPPAYPSRSVGPVSNIAMDLDTLLGPYLNLTDGDKLLYYTWVLHQRLSEKTLIPGLVYGDLPILALTGPKGSGKSLLTKITKGIFVREEWMPIALSDIPIQNIETWMSASTVLTCDDTTIPDQYSTKLADLAETGFHGGQGIILNGTDLTIPDNLYDYVIQLKLQPLASPVPEEELLPSIGTKLDDIRKAFCRLCDKVVMTMIHESLFEAQNHNDQPQPVRKPDYLYNYLEIGKAYSKLSHGDKTKVLQLTTSTQLRQNQ